uniref:Ovule protein n=1 Tax=Parascaris univalens TaxID=6257 RepID=A0A915BR88_PARUN
NTAHSIHKTRNAKKDFIRVLQLGLDEITCCNKENNITTSFTIKSDKLAKQSPQLTINRQKLSGAFAIPHIRSISKRRS